MKYTKKPVTIEAVVWAGDNIEEVVSFIGWKNVSYDKGKLRIQTLEGDLQASFGDYIIKGVKGEFYPCKPDIFSSTYTKEDGKEV